MQLEQMMGYQPMQMQRTQERQKVYTIVDLEYLSAGALYGDMDRVYDFKESGFQFHIHEDSEKGITGASIKPYGEKHGIPLNNYEALMGEVTAINLGIPRIDIGSRS